MGLLVKHVQDHPGGRKSFRRQYPSHLRPYLTGRQYRVSLGREGDPGFLSRYEAALAKWEADVARAKREHEGKYDRLDDPTIAFLTEHFKRDWHVKAEAALDEGRQNWLSGNIDGWGFMLGEYKEWRGESDFAQMEAYWGDTAQTLLSTHSILADPADTEGFRRLCAALNKAAILCHDDVVAHLSGAPRDIPAAPEAPARPALGGPKQTTGPGLLEIFDLYAAPPQLTSSVRREWRHYIEHLVAFVGHDDAARLTRDDVVAWRDHLLQTPTRHGRPRKAVTVRDKYISALRASLRWAVEERKLGQNVAADVAVRVRREVRTRGPEFTTPEAVAILTAALKPPAGKLSAPNVRARRWVPWLCAYSGARVNEVGQLRKQDVKQVDGVWVINLTPEAGTIKTGQFREVPIHAHLIEQGFVEFVRAQADGPLFYDPARIRSDAEGNRHIKKVGERLAAWVRKEVGVDDPRIKPNHAWRHLFKTISREAGIAENVCDAITGHAPLTVGRGYGSGTIKAKADAMARFPRYMIAESS